MNNAFYVNADPYFRSKLFFGLVQLNPVAIGTLQAPILQSECAIAIGERAGQYNQGECAIAVGKEAGYTQQGTLAVAIGAGAGAINQSSKAIALGAFAGSDAQSTGSIAIGTEAGQYNQGENAIALGSYAGQTSQHANSIVLNATGTPLDTLEEKACYIAPLRDAPGDALVQYNTLTNELTASNTVDADLSVNEYITSLQDYTTPPPFPQQSASFLDFSSIVDNPPGNILDFQGGVLAPNGNIYFFPGRSTRVLVVDPKTDHMFLLPTPVLPNNTNLKYFGGVVAQNGKIYGIPDQSNIDSVLIIDPATNSIDQTSITGLATTNEYSGWKGGVLALNGKIYCSPYTARNVLVIDPETNTADTHFITDLYNVASNGNDLHRWHGGALAPNGKIYFCPLHFNSRVLIVDPESPVTSLGISSSILQNSTITNLTLNCPGFDFTGLVNVGDNILITTTSDLNNGNTHYTGYVQTISGADLVFIWRPVMSLSTSGDPTTLIPTFLDVPAGKIVDLRKTRRADVTTISSFPQNFFQYSGCALGADGAIYCVPYLAGNIRRIDPSNNSVTILSLPFTSPIGEAYRCAIQAEDGKIYCIPCQETRVTVINTLDVSKTRTFFAISGVIPGNRRFFGGVLANNTSIYCCPGPFSTTFGLLKIRTALPTIPNWPLRANFNKI